MGENNFDDNYNINSIPSCYYYNNPIPNMAAFGQQIANYPSDSYDWMNRWAKAGSTSLKG